MVSTETDRETGAQERQRKRFRPATVAAYAIACFAPLITAGLYYQAARSAGAEIGFPLDDSWIHTQYARTIVEGRPFEYVPGHVSMGTTAILFDVVWAAATLLTGEYIHTIYVVNLLLTCAVGALIVALGLRFGLPALTAGVGAALIVSSYPFPWSVLSGMETALAACMTTAAVLAHLTWGRKTGWRELVAPVLMALAALSRPENLILFPLSELDRLLLRWRNPDREKPKRPALRFGTRAAAFGLILLPAATLNYSAHGGPLPNTYAVKVGNVGLLDDLKAEGLHALTTRLKVALSTIDSSFWFVAAKDNWLLLTLAALGALIIFFPHRRRGPAGDSFLPLLVFIGCPAAVGLVTLGLFYPGQSQRYLIQWIPLILIYGVVGIHFLARGLGALFKSAARPAYATGVVLVAIANIALLRSLYPEQVEEYVTALENINQMQVTLGKWVNENTPEDTVIATNDIGAIAFFSERPLVDTIGHVDPEIVRLRRLPDHKEAMLEFLQKRGVTYALLFPSWHPDLILDPRFKPVHRVVLEDNVICGDDRMLVMKIDWNLNEKDDGAPEWAAEELANCRMWLKAREYFPLY